MFNEEREDLGRVFDFYEGKFKDQILLSIAIYSNDELDIDALWGVEKGFILGFRAFHLQDDGAMDGAVDEGRDGKGKNTGDDGDGKDDDEDNGKDDEEGDERSLFLYEFTLSGLSPDVKIPGIKVYSKKIEYPEQLQLEGDGFILDIYKESEDVNADLCCITVQHLEGDLLVYLENESLY
ncbi:MAG: hypothetical protein ACTSUE_11780 [Promethearchaeota archaeon]